MAEKQAQKQQPQARRKLPSFRRQNWAQKKRIAKSGWRKPRGIDNKLRIKKGGFGFLPKIGFRTPRKERGLHPTGLREVLVRSLKDLAGLKGVAIRVSAGLGRRKKLLLVAEAKKMQLRILNE